MGSDARSIGSTGGADAAGLVPRYPIEGIPIAHPTMRATQLERGNWLGMSIGDSLRTTAKANPDKIAVVDPKSR